jgi:hypothetical protein
MLLSSAIIARAAKAYVALHTRLVVSHIHARFLSLAQVEAPFYVGPQAAIQNYGDCKQARIRSGCTIYGCVDVFQPGDLEIGMSTFLGT